MEIELTTQSEQISTDFVEWLFDMCSGRAQVRLGSGMPGYDRKRGDVFIDQTGKKTIWMPAALFLDHLTTEEVEQLKDLPNWNGRNETVISGSVLASVDRAIARYKQVPINDSEGRKCLESISNGVLHREYNPIFFDSD
jgi:hypothetical protein